MPAVQSGKILVTGANGYLASWVIKSLLEQNYSVRATVRSEAKGAYIGKLFSSYGNRLEFVVVEDMCQEGALDNVLHGIDAIQHVASTPVPWDEEDPHAMAEAMVQGVRGVLRSAQRCGSKVKRVIVTSSTVAVKNIPPPTTGYHVFTEDHFNHTAIREVEEKGFDTVPVVKFAAGKTLAELAAWEFYKAEKSRGLKWDMVILVPPFTFGPPFHHDGDASTLRVPMNAWYNHVLGGKTKEVPWTVLTGGGDWVDIRDLSDAHVLMLQEAAAGGHRFILSAGQWTWDDWVQTARRISGSDNLPKEGGKPVYPIHLSKLDASKVQRVLGTLQYRSIEDCTRAILEFFEKKGWWES